MLFFFFFWDAIDFALRCFSHAASVERHPHATRAADCVGRCSTRRGWGAGFSPLRLFYDISRCRQAGSRGDIERACFPRLYRFYRRAEAPRPEADSIS